MAPSALLRAERVSLAFAEGERPFTAVDGVDVSLEDRRYMAIVGPSGSGKSSLLYLLSGLRRPTSGSVHFRGVDYFRNFPVEASHDRRWSVPRRHQTEPDYCLVARHTCLRHRGHIRKHGRTDFAGGRQGPNLSGAHRLAHGSNRVKHHFDVAAQ